MADLEPVELARRRAEQIRSSAEALWKLLLEAYEAEDWKVLGYGSWANYVKGEFDMERRNSYLLVNQGRVIRALETATGEQRAAHSVSARAADQVKHRIPQVAKKVRKAVKAGVSPQEAVDGAIIDASSRERPSPEARAHVPRPAPDDGEEREELPEAPERAKSKRQPDVRPAPDRPAVTALLTLDPHNFLSRNGRPATQEMAGELEAWLTIVKSTLRVRSADDDVSPADCTHPVNRKIGDRCGVCGASLRARAR